MEENKRTILITGATDGIGLALARLYSQAGDQLILVGRKSLSELRDTLFNDENYCRADLSKPKYSDSVARFIEDRGIDHIDSIIHNAAIGRYGKLGESESDIRELMDVNLVAPIALTKRLLPLVKNSNGSLIFISSIAATLPCPDYAVYASSKSALDGFARSLRLELRGSVTVQVIHPGATRTGMHAKMGLDNDAIDSDRFPSAQDVAARIRMAIDSGKANSVIGAANQLIYAIGRTVPRPLDWLMTLKMPGRCSRRKDSAARLCVITGAADGIGKSLARVFGEQGCEIIGIDVDESKSLETTRELEARGITASFLIADLASPNGVNEVVSQLREWPKIDILIHNAGISCVGRFESSDISRQQSVVDLNLIAPLTLTNKLAQLQVLAEAGSVVFVSSLSKYVSYPTASVYAATKDGVASYARGVRLALYPSQHVLAVFPGPTRTEHARKYSPDNSREQNRMPPDAVAHAIADAVSKRKSILVPGIGNKAAACLGHCLPWLAEKAMRQAFLTNAPDAGKSRDK